MNTSMSRDVLHSQSICPPNVTSQFMAPEIYLKLRTPFAMIITLQLGISIIMVGQWFLITQQWIFIINGKINDIKKSLEWKHQTLTKIYYIKVSLFGSYVIIIAFIIGFAIINYLILALDYKEKIVEFEKCYIGNA
eukprot:459089_1